MRPLFEVSLVLLVIFLCLEAYDYDENDRAPVVSLPRLQPPRNGRWGGLGAQESPPRRTYVYVESEEDYRSTIDRLLREIGEDWQENEREYRKMAKGDGIVAHVIRGDDLED